MNMKIALAAAAASLAIANPARAAVIDILFSANVPDERYSVITQEFTLPTGFTDGLLSVASLTSDDAAVVALNGTNLFGTGIFGPGNGNFYFTASGPSTPFTFQANGSGGTFTGPFSAGLNTLTVYLNNNNAGINADNGPLTGGPASIDFAGTVSYNVAPVPEPATWAMMIAGFGLVGGAMRRRNRQVTTTVRYA